MSGYGLFGLRAGAAPMAAWLTVAIMISFVGHVCALVGGVLGIAGIRPAFSRPLNIATIALSITAAIAPGVWGLIVGNGMTSPPTDPSGNWTFVLVQVLRLVVVTYTLIVLAAAGLCELLVSQQFGPGSTSNDPTLSTSEM